MEGYQTEEQQLIVIREFWQKNRLFIVALVVVLCGILFGTHMLRHHTAKKAEQASNLYQEMLLAVQNVDISSAKDKGTLLLKDYSKTPYAVLGAMMLAKISVDEQDLSVAIDKYRYILKNSKKGPLWHVAKIRLARLLHANKEDQKALQELVGPADSYTPLYEELKGDIYVSLNDLAKARESYRLAIASSHGNQASWLEMKLANINTIEDASKQGVIDGIAVKTNS